MALGHNFFTQIVPFSTLAKVNTFLLSGIRDLQLSKISHKSSGTYDTVFNNHVTPLFTGSNLSEVRMVEESRSMKDACKIMLEPLTENGRVRVTFSTSLLEEARTAGRGQEDNSNF